MCNYIKTALFTFEGWNTAVLTQAQLIHETTVLLVMSSISSINLRHDHIVRLVNKQKNSPLIHQTYIVFNGTEYYQSDLIQNTALIFYSDACKDYKLFYIQNK